MTTHRSRRVPEFGHRQGRHRESRLATALIGGICVLAFGYGAIPALAYLINLAAIAITVVVVVGLAVTATVHTTRTHRTTRTDWVARDGWSS